MSVKKVHKIEGEAAKKIMGLYDASHKAYKAVNEAQRASEKSKQTMWDAIHTAVGGKNGRMVLNTAYSKTGLLLVEEVDGADDEKCPGCGQVHGNDDEQESTVINLAELFNAEKVGAKDSPLTAIIDKIVAADAPQHVKDAWAKIKARKTA